MVHHRLFCQYKHHQLGNRFRTFVENGKQKGIQLSGKPVHEPGNENAQDQYHQRRFAERFCKRHQRKDLHRQPLAGDHRQVGRPRTGSGHCTRAVAYPQQMIVSIVFVGIFAMLAQMAMRSVYYSSMSRRRDEKNNTAIIIVLVMVVAAIGYFFSMLMRFAISRKREYLADAGAAEMTKNPLALASALRKISADPDIEAVKREDVAQLFIQHPGQQAKSALNGLSGLFATHPPIEKRIQVLEQF